MKTYNSFIDLCCEQIPWPEAEVRRVLQLHLEAAHISERDVELYINYPEFTEEQLAVHFGVPRSTVGGRLARIRRAWPSLLRDPGVNQHGAPFLPAMLTYEPWMDEFTVQKF